MLRGGGQWWEFVIFNPIQYGGALNDIHKWHMALLENFHYELIFYWLTFHVSWYCIGGCKKFGSKSFIFGRRSHFLAKKGPKWAKIGKIDHCLQKGANFLGLWIFFSRVFWKNNCGHLLGIPWGTCAQIFINLGHSGAVSIGGALYAPPVAAKEFHMPYWIGLNFY